VPITNTLSLTFIIPPKLSPQIPGFYLVRFSTHWNASEKFIAGSAAHSG
jgi:hypothetical protein